MFLFTAASHFAPMRKDLIAMVAAPPLKFAAASLWSNAVGTGRRPL
jgi:hypothetical protein